MESRNSDPESIAREREFESLMETICVDFVVHAFRSLGASLSQGDSLSAESFATELGVEVSHLRKLVNRFLEDLEENGFRCSSE